MSAARSTTTLKVGPNRTVLLEIATPSDGRDVGLATDSPAARVVKRFHARRRLGRLRDAQRARRELRTLAALREAGLPVPEPFGTRRTSAGWELACAWIEGAVAVDELLQGRTRWPKPPGALAAELGRLLARAHRAGLDHADLHAGNALIDGDGRAWLVDFTKARVRARLPRRAVLRDLTSLAAGARERCTFGFRARFLLAYAKEYGAKEYGATERGAPTRADRSKLASRIEAGARARRRKVAARQRARWTRESSVCRRIPLAGADALARRDLALDDASRIAALLAEHAARVKREGGPAGTFLALGDGVADRALWIESFGRERELLRCWSEMGRAADHELPCARPACALLEPIVAAAFELGCGASPAAALACDADAQRMNHLARGAGRLAGALHDRGLGLRGATQTSLWFEPSGRVLLAPSARLVRARAPGALAGWRDWHRAFAPGSARVRASFASGFASELRGGPAERARMRRELRNG